VQYDFYGKRMATCSSDHKIKVWDMNTQGNWICTYEWKAHNGSVWKVQWAHPEFGQVLASCSYDHTCCIWEEPPVEQQQQQQQQQNNPQQKRKQGWTQKATLVDSPQGVVDIKFAPKHHGLKLATCSLDGHVRIYEALDVMNLAYWTVHQEFEATSNRKPATCLSWNPSRFEEPMLVIGSADGSVTIRQCDSNHRRWQLTHTLEPHAQAVNDVAWAPNLGRSYHLIASASKDGTARIWKLEKDKNGNYVANIMKTLNDHSAEVWKVEWNLTGTILGTSGDDGTVRLYRYMNGDWIQEEQLTGTNTQQQQQ
jgi:nucleoporin SEH1